MGDCPQGCSRSCAEQVHGRGLLFPIILSLVWLLIINVVGNRTTSILVYNPGSSNVVQAVTAAFPNPKVTQAGSAGEVTTAFRTSGAKKATPYAVGLISLRP
jgi:hypothetical protein